MLRIIQTLHSRMCLVISGLYVKSLRNLKLVMRAFKLTKEKYSIFLNTHQLRILVEENPQTLAQVITGNINFSYKTVFFLS